MVNKMPFFFSFGQMTRQNKVKSAKGFGWCRNAKAKLAHRERERVDNVFFLKG